MGALWPVVGQHIALTCAGSDSRRLTLWVDPQTDAPPACCGNRHVRVAPRCHTMHQMLKLMPGFSGVSEKQLYEVEKKLKKYEGMISSMTPEVGENKERWG